MGNLLAAETPYWKIQVYYYCRNLAELLYYIMNCVGSSC